MSLVQTQAERDLLARALGDTAETARPSHFLRRGLVDAHVTGTGPRFDGLIVQSPALPEEPWCFGTDPSAIWELLRRLNAWGRDCMSPNVSAELARPLANLIEHRTGAQVHLYEDCFHTLTRPVRGFHVPGVRLLNLGDVGMLPAYRSNPRAMGFATYEDLLTHGVAAGAVVEDRLVALAYTSAFTAGYGDIAVSTKEAWRGMGFASALGCLVARRIQSLGRTPVWSAGEGNAASLRVAAKLGFAEVSRRVYLNVYCN